MLERKERSLCMSEEEALGLLDLALLCPGDLTADQRAAIIKLSDFCRQFLRDEAVAGPNAPAPRPAHASVVCAL